MEGAHSLPLDKPVFYPLIGFLSDFKELLSKKEFLRGMQFFLDKVFMICHLV